MPMDQQPQQPQQAYTTRESTPTPVGASSQTLDGGSVDGIPTLATIHSNAGTYAPNTYTNAPNMNTNMTNTYTDASNTYTNATNAYTNATNAYTNATGTYPNMPSIYPSANITYPNANVVYPTPNNHFPTGNNPSNDIQRNQTETVNGGQSAVYSQQPTWHGGYPVALNDSTNFNTPVNQQQVIGGNTNMSINHASNINVANNASTMIPYPMGYNPNGQVNVVWPNSNNQNITNTTFQNATTPGHCVPPVSMPQPAGTFTSAPAEVAPSQAGQEDKGKKKQSEAKRKVDLNDIRHAFNSLCGYNKGARAILPHPPGHPEYSTRYAPGSTVPYFDMDWSRSPRSDANLTVYENLIVRMRAEDQAIEDATKRRFEKACDDDLKKLLTTYFVTHKKQYTAQVEEEKREQNVKRWSGNRRTSRKRAKAGRRQAAIPAFEEQNGAENAQGLIDLILSDVQSSEYSDDEKPKSGFTVLDLPWRSTEVTHLYRELDRLYDESSTKAGGKGGVSKPRQADQKHQVCREPIPSGRPPAVCVKPLYQTHDNVVPNDPNWTITKWLASNVLDDGYDADSEGAGGTVAHKSNPTHTPENSGPTGNISAAVEGPPVAPAITGSVGCRGSTQDCKEQIIKFPGPRRGEVEAESATRLRLKLVVSNMLKEHAAMHVRMTPVGIQILEKRYEHWE
ncbi:hypothetical protein K435DRAFT_912789 [Dendrothele bispora CBS 962.96]|uniref:Uncharacterized protein n=1 Tax=Dendrothele bispora (strain CBS 962.96) TaxID=1314807 RepID=A0A4S8LLJ2_DENBC|nr:hypothetical protein K435DRAFT_912789 [Dendrothele bispora CBS 962.96]